MGEYWDVYDKYRSKTGRYHERGMPMQKGDYHIIVQVWVLNDDGEFLITKRIPGESPWANLWHTTSGCAVADDDSLRTALKETQEEIGVCLDPANGQLFKSYARPHTSDNGNAFFDIWLFRQDINISSVKLQPEEVCDAKWASKQEIIELINHDLFFPAEEYPYLSELFGFCS